MPRRGGMRPATVLLLLAAAACARAAAPGCSSYTSKGLIQPAVGSLQDVVVVQDAFVAQDVSLTIDLSHRRVGALKITLGAAPFSNAAGASAAHPTIILKSHGQGRRGQDMYHTTFSDSAPNSFPINASYAPFTGSFRPVQKLAFLIDGDTTVAGSGGSQGMWTLTVADVAPNNTLREIALNGWTLQLCDRQQPSPSPSPAPSPSTSAPAPPVEGYSGPPQDASSGSGASGNPLPTGTAGSSILGWQVVYRNQPPSSQPPIASGGPGPLPSGLPTGGPLADSLQQLLAQRPLLTLLQQQITAIASGIGGNCDVTCQQAKQSMWRAAIFGLYMHAVAEKHGVDGHDLAAWLQHVRDWLPGDNSRLGQLQDWLTAHADDMGQLRGWLHDHLRLPAIMVNGQPLQLPQLGHGAGLQQLAAAFSSHGAGVQQLLSAFANAGDRIASLATHFAGNTADHAQALAQLYSNGGQQLAALFGPMANNLMGALQAGQDAQQNLLGNFAGLLDSKGSAVQDFMTGLDGDNLQQLVGSLAGLFDQIQP